MKNLTLEEHRARLENLRRARSDVAACARELRIRDYMPGQVIYYLGDYPAPNSIAPTEYDYKTLKALAESGAQLIQVHEEWNDTIEKYGADKYSSYDPEGMKKFVELCHFFGLKIIPYCSSSYIHEFSRHYREDFSRCEKGCVDMHYKYRYGWAGSALWRGFIIPRTFSVMEDYGFDGIFNDWGYDWKNSEFVSVPPEKRGEFGGVEKFDPEAEDLIHILYDGVKERGGVYKLHVGHFDAAPVRWRCYDYLWVGEGDFSVGYGGGKMLDPYLVPCPDKPRLTNWGAERFDADAYFAMTIPFVQFPLLTYGRPTKGRCVDVPGVTQYNTTREDRLYQYFRRVRDWSDAHPEGPFVYSEWSQIPDDPEDFPRWSRYLALYREMTADQTVVFMEIRASREIVSKIPENVFITEFVGEKRFMAVSNMTEQPYTLTLASRWKDRVSGAEGSVFSVPPKRIAFLRLL